MTNEQHGKPKKRTQFGSTYRKRTKQPKKLTAEEMQRKAKAWLEFNKP
jgi:protoheme ferro-lyase